MAIIGILVFSVLAYFIGKHTIWRSLEPEAVETLSPAGNSRELVEPAHDHASAQLRQAKLPDVVASLAPNELPQNVREAADRVVGSLGSLLSGYSSITERAASGRLIQAQDFQRVEAVYNAGASDHELVDSFTATKRGPSLTQYLDAKLDRFRQRHSMTGQSDPLYRAFARQHIASGPATEDTRVSKSDRASRGALLEALLGRNAGIAVGELHGRPEAFALVADHMTLLRKSGVDTIYMEDSEPHFRFLAESTDAKLRNIVEHGESYQQGVLEKSARIYRTTADSVVEADKARARMFLEARRAGIRVLNIDKHGPARDAESEFTDQRVASTNFQWLDAIQSDRAKLQANDLPSAGKFLVIGGLFHFVSQKFESVKTHGLVDDALGIPTIAFTPGDASSAGVVVPGRNSNGADFQVVTDDSDYPFMDGLLLPPGLDMATQPSTTEATSSLPRLPLGKRSQKR